MLSVIESVENTFLGTGRVREFGANGYRLASSSMAGVSKVYLFQNGGIRSSGYLHFLKLNDSLICYATYVGHLGGERVEQLLALAEGQILGLMSLYHDMEEAPILLQLVRGDTIEGLSQLEGSDLGFWAQIQFLLITEPDKPTMEESHDETLNYIESLAESIDDIRSTLARKSDTFETPLVDLHQKTFREFRGQSRSIPSFDIWLRKKMQSEGHVLIPNVFSSPDSMSAEIVSQVQTHRGLVELSEYESIMQEAWLDEQIGGTEG